MITTAQLEAIARKLSPHPLALVERLALFPVHWCHDNVQTMISLHGGSRVFGWCLGLDRRISPEGRAVYASWHSVWQSPDGALVDVTCDYEGHGPRKICEGGRPYFLRAEQQQLLPALDKVFVLGNSKELARRVRAKNRELWEKSQWEHKAELRRIEFGLPVGTRAVLCTEESAKFLGVSFDELKRSCAASGNGSVSVAGGRPPAGHVGTFSRTT